VMDGADYLARANAGAAPALGRRVVVIGGGSAAIDAARSARRAGHEVTILALESTAQLPAQHDEVAEALEEGIVLAGGVMLTEAIETDSGLALKCVRVRFEAGAARGQFSVTPVAGSEFSLAADAIVSSIGQDPDLAPLRVALDADGALLKADQHQATSLDRVYAGGDVASMARFVTEAIGMGKRAAREIDRVLGGAEQGAEGAGADAGADFEGEPVVKLAAINTFYFPGQAEQRLDPAQRLAGDAEVQIGFDLEQALAETGRCFSCGTCIECDNCVHYCPDLAVKRNGGGYVVLADYCKGCGLCVKECPTGSMKMMEEAR
jgi:ferredoxin